MTQYTEDKRDRAVLVGLSAHSLPREECATEASMDASLQRKPSRDMPVSTLRWTFSVPPRASAPRAKANPVSASPTVWVRSRSKSSPVYSGAVGPRIRMGVPTPASRSSTASSRQATAR